MLGGTQEGELPPQEVGEGDQEQGMSQGRTVTGKWATPYVCVLFYLLFDCLVSYHFIWIAIFLYIFSVLSNKWN